MPYILNILKKHKTRHWTFLVRLVFTFILSKFIRRREIVFKIDRLSELGDILSSEGRVDADQNVSITKYECWDDVPSTYLKRIESYGESVSDDVLKNINSGGLLWVVTCSNTFAGIAISMKGENINKCFLPLKNEDIVISQCAIFDDFRGKGLYPLLLRNIAVQQVTLNEQVNIYISCLDWNIPSINGILKAGFKFIGFSYNKKKMKYTKVSKLPWLCNG